MGRGYRSLPYTNHSNFILNHCNTNPFNRFNIMSLEAQIQHLLKINRLLTRAGAISIINTCRV